MSRIVTSDDATKRASKERQKLLTYRTIPREHRDPYAWDVCSMEHMDETVRSRFLRFMLAVIDYVLTGALSAAAKQAECSTKALILQVNRCLAPKPNGRGILGWAGLINRLRIKPYTRRAPPPDGPQTSPRGRAGSFVQFLLEHKTHRDRLHKLIETGGGESKRRPSKRPTVDGVATRFINYLVGQDPKREKYPLNSDSEGRRSIERYVRKYLDTTSSATAVWEGKDIARGRRVGTGLVSFDFAEEIFSMCQMDAHRQDCIGTVVIKGPKGRRAVAINRISILAVVDPESHAVCGYTVVIRPEAGGKHVEEALLFCTEPWKPRQLKIKGLAYAPGAGFPVGCVEGLEQIRPSALSFDNAMINFAQVCAEKARKFFGCATTWGAIGGWWRRAVIERFFGLLEHHGFKRLSSSMGKGPDDPLRDDPVGNAVADGIEWDELLDLLDVLLANFNGTPLDSLQWVSPLDHIRGRMLCKDDPFVPRPPVQATIMTPALGVEVEYVHIRGGGQKNPYVELDGTPYTNELLSARRDWIGREVALHIPKDIRTLQVFQASGEFIGEVTCLERSWRRSEHSRDQRKTINALSANGDLYFGPDDDPIVVYANHLAEKAYESAGKGRPRISKEATKLAELAHSTGIAIPDTTPPPPPPRSSRSLPPGFEELGR